MLHHSTRSETTTEAQDKVQGGLLLDVIVGKGAAILELLAGEDEALLVWRDALLILDLGLHVVDGVRGFNLQSDGLASEGLHEDLHTSTKAQDKVQGGFLLDVVVCKGAAILELLPSKDETLLVWWDSLLVLDLGLHIIDRVGGLDLQGNGLAGEGLHEYLHASTKAEDKVQGGLLLDVIIRESTPILKLLASEDKALLVRRDALLVLNLSLHIVNRIGGLNLQGDGLASEGLNEYLHLEEARKDWN
jgi:hypothetical protein